MNAQQQQNVNLVAEFIDARAPEFHTAFGMPSGLNRATMQYEQPEVRDLRETLEYHQTVGKYVDFINDLNRCNWEVVHQELRKAKATAVESERRGSNFIRRAWRGIGSTSSILAPGLSAIPDDLCVLHGGLAVIFSLARHSEMNRLKILATFEKIPNIIEMAQNKVHAFPLDGENPQTIQLHKHIQELQATLLRTLPVLIDKLVPGTFRNAWKSPFGTWKIDKILDEVTACAESVRLCAESLIEELIVGNYSASMTIKAQLDEVLREHRMMRMSIDAANGKTHLLHFLMEQINFNSMGALPERDAMDQVSNLGTALPGYTPEDLLRIMDVSHLRHTNDATTIMRRGGGLSPAEIERAAHMIMAPQVKELLGTHGPSIVAIDGHFDRTQTGKISPLSYVCAMLSQALRQQSHQAAPPPASPMSPGLRDTASTKGPAPGSIVLEYFCTLHTTDGDDLRGPQGLMRCLTTQLLLALVATECIGPADALDLPHLRDGEEEVLGQLGLDAVARLFAALVRLVPWGMPVYCLIDGWSAYECEGLWQADYDVVLGAFREAADAGNSVNGGNNFRLLLTSPTACRWLDDFVLPGQRVSLRNRHGSGGNWRGAGRGGLMGLARAATMPDVNSGFGGGFPADEPDQAWVEDGHDRRSST